MLAIAAITFLIRVATLLWAEHKVADDRERTAAAADIAFERARSAASDQRLEVLGGLLRDATTVMDRSVELTEKALDQFRGPRSGR